MGRLLIVIFYLYKVDILICMISPYVGNIVWAKFTASKPLAYEYLFTLR